MRQAFSLGLALLFALTAGLVQGTGTFNYVSGGIGVAEQERLKAHEDVYNLKLVFTLVEGNYVADVRVLLKDAAGNTVIEDIAGGPFFMAKLAPGRYQVTATYEGKTVTRDVTVSDKRLRTEYLRWSSNPATDLAVSRWTER